VKPELNLINAALTTERSLQKVLVFQPSIAAQAKQQALAAIILACIAMAAYLWFRFGALDYGLAAIVALLHSVSIAVGMVALSYYISQTFLGPLLLIDDFRIDLAMVAAFLTVLGYSVNDTIVVFDRIRENRGKLKSLSPELINKSLNQTLARTLLTGTTTLIVILIMYVSGGAGIHGFNYVLLIGIVTGTYSSIAIASPLLLNRYLLRASVYAVLALGVFGVGLSLDSTIWKAVVCVAALGAGAYFIWRELREARGDRGRAASAIA
jgi:SecD/SecF fusion protein